MPTEIRRFFAPQAWVQGAWQHDVLLNIDALGAWSGIEPNASVADSQGASLLPGPVLPGVANTHSHAFQRAIAGLTERRGLMKAPQSDDFWSWRDRMYSVARRITPEQLEDIAAFLYAELLAGGYTQVCEFHYLHNAIQGQAQADPLEMSLALVRAAQRTGMGLTLLPTLYMRSGFGAKGLRDDQQRFASTPESVMRLVDGITQHLRSQGLAAAAINVGVAIHSLRAADAPAMQELSAFAKHHALPVHIHIAEQVQEVQDCLDHTGQRPIEWLMNHLPVDAQWNLVHATHTTPAQLQAVQRSGAAIVICPSTEANLGDGVFDYSGYASLGGQWSVGSDSHVTRCWVEELRLLEYSQRLVQRKRNVAAQTSVLPSSAAALFEAALGAAKSATAKALGGIEIGHRADFLVLNPQSAALLGVPSEQVLDALVFSSPTERFSEVFVAGQSVTNLARSIEIKTRYVRAMKALWG